MSRQTKLASKNMCFRSGHAGATSGSDFLSDMQNSSTQLQLPSNYQAHAVTTHNHSVHLGDDKDCLPKLKASLTACFSSPSCRKLPSQVSKTPAFAENFCSKPKRPATNQILLRTAKTSQDCGKTAKTACFQRIFASHQLSSSEV